MRNVLKFALPFVAILALCVVAAPIMMGASRNYTQHPLTTVTNLFTKTDMVSVSYDLSAYGTGTETVDLGASYNHILIWTSSGSGTLNVRFDGSDATTSNAVLYDDTSLSLSFKAGVQEIDLYVNTASGTLNILASN